MSAKEVDEYLSGVEEPGRSSLERLRTTILEIVPDAEQVISYGLPAFRVRGATVAGFAAFKNHLSYVPFSGSVLGQLGDELEGYKMTKSSLHFGVERPLPKALVKKLIAIRLEEADSRSRKARNLAVRRASYRFQRGSARTVSRSESVCAHSRVRGSPANARARCSSAPSTSPARDAKQARL